MITFIVNYMFNGNNYRYNILTKGYFTIDSIKEEICKNLMSNNINTNTNIKDDIKQIIINNIIIQSITIATIIIDEQFPLDVEIKNTVFKNPYKYNIKIINN